MNDTKLRDLADLCRNEDWLLEGERLMIVSPAGGSAAMYDNMTSFVREASPAAVLALYQRIEQLRTPTKEALTALNELAEEAAGNGNSREPGAWLAVTVDKVRAALHVSPVAALSAPTVNLAALVRYEPTDLNRHYADFPEGPMSVSAKGRYFRAVDVERALAAVVAPEAPTGNEGIWSWERRAEAANNFLRNYADANMEKLLGDYEVQPIVRRLAAAIKEWQEDVIRKAPDGVCGTDSPVAAPEANDIDERADEAFRLRRVVRALGMESEVPDNDATLRDCLFSVLGQIAYKLERASASGEKPFAGPGDWFSVDVLGNPMREYAPGKWENCEWPSARRAAVSTTGDAALEPVEGDLLPPVGSRVLIHLARQDEWVEHTVVGYYVWGWGKDDSLHRVFVRIKDRNGYLNARLLKDVRPAAPQSPTEEA